jgi:hypothetical protein
MELHAPLASPFGPHPKRRIDGKAARIICPFLLSHPHAFRPDPTRLLLETCIPHLVQALRPANRFNPVV